MSEEPKSHASPRPWRVNSVTGGHISDANGDPVCFCVGSSCGERAALIVEAVNEYSPIPKTEMLADAVSDNIALVDERDRLRDIVRRLARVAQDTLYFAEAMATIIPDNPERAKARSEIEAILREARAAIGEDKT